MNIRDPESPVYIDTLELVLEHANQMDKQLDYCQLRDIDNNGLDLFYFGFSNQESIKKNCYAQIVNKHWQDGQRIYFTKEDSQKIINEINKSEAKHVAKIKVI